MTSRRKEVAASVVFQKCLAFWRFVAVFILSLGIAFTFGWEFLVQNQNTYLAHAIAELNPDLLSRDWFASETAPYHWVFTDFVVTVGDLLPLPVILPAVLLVLISAPLISMFYLLRRINPCAAWFCFSLVGLWFVLSRTESVGGSYLFDNVLQASSFSVSLMMLALVCFSRGFFLLAGLLLAISGAFHGNYLLLSLPGFGLALWLAYGNPERGVKRWLHQRLTCLRDKPFWLAALKLLGPPLLVFLAFLPGLQAIMADPLSAEGAYIFSHIRSPWHYLPERFLTDFIAPALWVFAAAIALPQVLPGIRALGRLACVWGAFTVMIFVAVLLTTVVFVPAVDQLFVWRLTPFVILCSLLFLVVFVSQKDSVRRPKLCAIGFGVILGATLLAHVLLEPGTRLGGLSPLAVLLVLCVLRCVSSLIGRDLPQRALSMLTISVLLVFVIRGDVQTLKTSTAIHGVADAQEAALYSAMSKTPRDALFLIPPQLQGFRLSAQRAVVVDWKSTPYLGSLLVEWHRRISDVSGRNVVSERDAALGYSRMDLAHLRRLVDEYGVDYAVFERRGASWLPGWSPFYENERFLVYRVARLSE